MADILITITSGLKLLCVQISKATETLDPILVTLRIPEYTVIGLRLVILYDNLLYPYIRVGIIDTSCWIIVKANGMLLFGFCIDVRVSQMIFGVEIVDWFNIMLIMNWLLVVL